MLTFVPAQVFCDQKLYKNITSSEKRTVAAAGVDKILRAAADNGTPPANTSRSMMEELINMLPHTQQTHVLLPKRNFQRSITRWGGC